MSLTETNETEYKTIKMITVNPEYSTLVYPLSDLEYETLKNSIKEDGLHYPIAVNPKGEVLDGKIMNFTVMKNFHKNSNNNSEKEEKVR